jgi:hypothetical protein
MHNIFSLTLSGVCSELVEPAIWICALKSLYSPDGAYAPGAVTAGAAGVGAGGVLGSHSSPATDSMGLGVVSVEAFT